MPFSSSSRFVINNSCPKLLPVRNSAGSSRETFPPIPGQCGKCLALEEFEEYCFSGMTPEPFVYSLHGELNVYMPVSSQNARRILPNHLYFHKDGTGREAQNVSAYPLIVGNEVIMIADLIDAFRPGRAAKGD